MSQEQTPFADTLRLIRADKHPLLRHVPVPLSLEQRHGDAMYRQGLALMALMLMVNVVVAALFIVLFAVGHLAHIDLGNELRVLAVMFGVTFVQAVSYYWSANIRIASMLIMLTYYFMCMGAIVISGAGNSPLIPLLLCPVVVAFRFGNREDGLMNILFVSLSGFGLAGVREMGLPVNNLLHGIPESLLFLIGMLATLFTVVICLSTYTFDRDD